MSERRKEYKLSDWKSRSVDCWLREHFTQSDDIDDDLKHQKFQHFQELENVKRIENSRGEKQNI